jgi:hypothetical protein
VNAGKQRLHEGTLFGQLLKRSSGQQGCTSPGQSAQFISSGPYALSARRSRSRARSVLRGSLMLKNGLCAKAANAGRSFGPEVEMASGA